MKTSNAIASRVFDKRETAKSNWSGRVGMVEFAINAPKKDEVEFTIGGTVIPDASAVYLMHFALQSLQDAYAGAESLVEACAAFDKKLAALMEGTIGVRSGNGGESDEDRAEWYVAEMAVRTKVGADEWKAMADDVRVKRVESAIEKLRAADPDGFAANVAARVAKVVADRKERADAKASVAAMAAKNAALDI